MNSNWTKTIILAGGFGTRLQSEIGLEIPKPMAHVYDGKPFLFFLIQELIDQGAHDFILSLHHKAEVIIKYLKEHPFPKHIQLEYVVEPTPLGTGGALKFLLNELKINPPFIQVVNGDTFCIQALKVLAMSPWYLQENLLLLNKTPENTRYGSVEINEETSDVLRFLEKNPKPPPSSFVYTGVSALETKGLITYNKTMFSLENDYFPTLIEDKKLKCIFTQNDFIDIGIPKDYHLFKEWMKKNMTNLNIPLMSNNITVSDREVLIEFLKKDEILTQSKNVREFEKEWSNWLGVKYSVFVNSGASANLLSIAALKHIFGGGEIIVPPLTWVSDIASVLHYGFKPVFVDIDPRTLAMKDEDVLSKITNQTKAVFLTHVLGYNGLTQKLLDGLKEKNVLLIEDVCESHGATFKNKRLGSFGEISNFSFYYAHHMSTIEGGMICTDNEEFYETFRMLRSHGMTREAHLDKTKEFYKNKYPDLNPDFIFSMPAYNVRSTEINAIIGRNQLKRLDQNNLKRTKNLKLFLSRLDPKKYRTDFEVEGSVNYAFTLVLKNPDQKLWNKVESTLREANVEFRRGLSGGGNQMRQPYVRHLFKNNEFESFSEVEHVHFYGCYIGNYPDLEEEKITSLCDLLNKISI